MCNVIAVAVLSCQTKIIAEHSSSEHRFSAGENSETRQFQVRLPDI
jgi:hypothetical protein